MVASSFVLSVRLGTPALVVPAEPTPRELKTVSDLDAVRAFRHRVPFLFFFRRDQTVLNTSRSPASTIHDAISKVLVHYYPLAGRLREAGDDRKLVVDCTGQGVVFIEAESDIRLEQLGDRIRPPFPYWEKLLPELEGSMDILHSPLLHIQVTHLSCGGFVLGVWMNHVIFDATGFIQFLRAAGELATGAVRPSVWPVWERDLLSIRSTPQLPSANACKPPMFVEETPEEKAAHRMMLEDGGRAVCRSFFFGPTELSSLRKQLPPDLQSSCTTFEILAACLCRCRTVALGPEPDKLVRLVFAADMRARMTPKIPAGYYGNCVGLWGTACSAANLCNNSLQYAIELIRAAKLEINDNSLRTMMELGAANDRPAMTWSFAVSSLRHLGFDCLDFGWGAPVYGGPAAARSTMVCWVVPTRNSKEEFEGLVVELRLPAAAMDRFTVEIEKMTADVAQEHKTADGLEPSLV